MIDTIDKDKLLHYALENGIIDLSSIRQEYEMKEYERRLRQHTNKIWQGKNGRWFTYVSDGIGGRKLISKSTRQEVEDVIVGVVRKKEDPTVKEIFNEWVDKKLKYGDIVESTHTRYKVTFKSYFQELGRCRIKDVTPMDIEDFAKTVVAENQLSKKSYGRITLILNGIFNSARKKGLIDFRIKDVMDDIEFSKNAFSKTIKSNDERIFSEAEEQMIREYLRKNPDTLNLGLLILFKTGLRIGELAALTRKDVSANFISVNKTETAYFDGKHNVVVIRDHPKTDAGVREVVIDNECQEILRKIRLMNPFGEYLFMKDGKRCKTQAFRRRLARICKRLSIQNKSPHKIRATYGTKLYDSEVPKSFICTQMGHTNISCLEQNYYFDRMSEQKRIEQINSIAGL